MNLNKIISFITKENELLKTIPYTLFQTLKQNRKLAASYEAAIFELSSKIVDYKNKINFFIGQLPNKGKRIVASTSKLDKLFLAVGLKNFSKETISQIRKLQKEVAVKEQEFASMNTNKESLNKNTETKLLQYLKSINDSDAVGLSIITVAQNSVNYHLDLIQKALKSLSGANTVEFFDLFTNNRLVSAYSYLRNQRAMDQIKFMKNNHQNFIQTISALTNLGSIDIPHISNFMGLETLDLLFDMFAHSRIDFTSILTLNRLAKAKRDLKEYQRKILDIKAKIDALYNDNLKNVKIKVDEMINAADF